MEIGNASLVLLMLIIFSSCSATEPQEIFYRHENQFNSVANILLDNRKEMLQKAICGVSEDQMISFTVASFGKCFGTIDEKTQSKLRDFLVEGYASHVYVKEDQVKFQIAVKGDNLLNQFYYAVYTLKDQVPIITSERNSVEKIKSNWYLVKEVQDIF